MRKAGQLKGGNCTIQFVVKWQMIKWQMNKWPNDQGIKGLSDQRIKWQITELQII